LKEQKLDEINEAAVTTKDNNLTGTILQKLEGQDIHVHKDEKSYFAVHYKLDHVFAKDALIKTYEFRTLEKLNDHLIQTYRQLMKQSGFAADSNISRLCPIKKGTKWKNN
ncbi:MAG: hypothetical protein NTW04_06085, partial [Elusimicrobia bacterium]|nr:hypothetical protein [Elusimicrobiota bacterium]